MLAGCDMEIQIKTICWLAGLLIGLGVGWGTMVAIVRRLVIDVKNLKGCLFKSDGTLVYMPAEDVKAELKEIKDLLKPVNAYVKRNAGHE